MVQVDTSSRGLSDVYHPNSAFGDMDRESYNVGVATTASYADILLIDNRANNSLVITMLETGAAQTYIYKILGSLKDGVTVPVGSDASYVTIYQSPTLAVSTIDYQTIAFPWKWIAVRVINGSGAATITARARGTR